MTHIAQTPRRCFNSFVSCSLDSHENLQQRFGGLVHVANQVMAHNVFRHSKNLMRFALVLVRQLHFLLLLVIRLLAVPLDPLVPLVELVDKLARVVHGRASLPHEVALLLEQLVYSLVHGSVRVLERHGLELAQVLGHTDDAA